MNYLRQVNNHLRWEGGGAEFAGIAVIGKAKPYHGELRNRVIPVVGKIKPGIAGIAEEWQD
jgi:hypothetical protein